METDGRTIAAVRMTSLSKCGLLSLRDKNKKKSDINVAAAGGVTKHEIFAHLDCERRRIKMIS
jgi:hypothetical protein